MQLNADKDLVLADKAQIQQALVILMRNACDAMRVSKLRRSTLATSREDQTLRVDVIDSGQSLSHVDSFASGKPGGLGVGLTICRSILEAHRGKIWAGSDPGGGARFCFTLPLAEADPRRSKEAVRAYRSLMSPSPKPEIAAPHN